MKLIFYYYNCSPEYVQSLEPGLDDQIISVISRLPKRKTQSEINADLFWLFASEGWSYDTIPTGAAATGISDKLGINLSLHDIKKGSNRSLCLTSTTLA